MCFKPRVCELPDRLIACDNYEFTNWEIGGLCAIKHISDHQSLDLWELTHEFLSLIPPSFISPTHSILYPARHIPSFGGAWGGNSSGLGRHPLWAWDTPALGLVRPYFWAWKVFFRGLGDRISRLSEHSYPTVSSHIPSFRRGLGRLLFVNIFPFRFPIYALLRSKRCPFAM